ncbi:SSS sodium solute transporter superfamily (plasmid) [Emticicia oligotrophica DSM 17448]|uniref:SSS sodium solute transporter superfamily n=1 Tax=Emticicia oligotrophica (strain DSM 17448 / CIP 109782 / MTCC 6937 / GPTSA100-15) TaxID=929562 RepID=A0ABN4AT52_EMTOG|nr:sodium/solute symporter [Emticicia oligotrophica]AFK05739.1 SSS sodium solute transporter superfamily [Emticicia oligotrophica DSM 17448]
MITTLQTFDYIVLLGLLIFLIVASMYSSFKKKDSEEYFMAGRSLRWWSVAGSIFGTNIHAQQIIGMMGVGYSVGFAQSHYEVWAVVAILVLVYVFIPIYRKRNFFTLSQFLEKRYNSNTRLAYMVVMIAFIMIQLVGGFYIGSRTLGLLFAGSPYEITYFQGILIIAVVTVIFSVFGGMESVVIADNILTVVMIVAVLIIGTLTYMQPEIGGFSGLLKIDHAGANKMHLFLPTNHKDLPWLGIFTGLTILNFFYWTTNQYQVQRVLAAKTERDAKLGAIASGFLKLIIPFFSIAVGTAAYYIFRIRFGENVVKPDDTFMTLLKVVVPSGLGLKGLVLAGLICAIFSAIYSMMNSVSTMMAFDVYKKHINAHASDRQTVRFGQIFVCIMVGVAIILAMITFDPNSSDNFFLKIAKQTSYIKPGLVIVFFCGILWKKTNPIAAVIVLLGSPLIGLFCDLLYEGWLVNFSFVKATFGENFNFLYRVFSITFLGSIIIIILSKILNKKNTHISGESLELMGSLKDIQTAVLRFSLIHIPLITLGYNGIFTPQLLAIPAIIFTFLLFIWYFKHSKEEYILWESDIFYAGLLTSSMVGILYYFA